jgi:hypothetical protein
MRMVRGKEQSFWTRKSFKASVLELECFRGSRE